MSPPDSDGNSPPHRPRVLLVDDNAASNIGLARFLTASGFEVSVVQDGASALATLQEKSPPDFLLTDLRLPDIDGRELARQARLLARPPKVALITGWDLDPNAPDDSLWGIDWVFAKPVLVQELINRLRQSWEATSRSHPSSSPTTPESPSEAPGSA